MRRKIMSLIISLLLICQLITPVALVQAATVLTGNKTGNDGGYDYELWKDYGTTSMTLNSGGTFSCNWSNIGNALFRKGKKFDCTKTYEQLGNIKVDYGCKYNPSGNSYLCVYGWTRNPLIEYYIVESWGSWRPPGATSKGTITVDGGTYDVYETDRINQPSIDGNTTFKQFWSVRTSKKTSGTISVSEHFKAWARMGMNLGKMYEIALTVEGYQSSGSADVYQNDIVIGGSSTGGGGQVTPTQGTVTTSPAVNPGTSANLTEGLYYIKGVGSQKYLQVKGNTAADGQNVEIGTGTGVAGQKWYLANTGDGYVTLKSALGNYMLDVAYGSADDGANAQIYSAYSGDPQKFQIKGTDGVYTILPKGGNGAQALDVANASSADGANVQQWSVNGAKNQQWIFEPVNSSSQGGTTQTTTPTVNPTSQAPSQPSTNPSGGSSTGTGLPAGVTATYSVVSDWGGSFQAQIVLKNGSSQTLNNWQLAFNYANKIGNLWGAELASQTGDQVLVKAPSWDANLAPGQSVTINFIANGSSSIVPSGYSTSGVPSSGGSSNSGTTPASQAPASQAPASQTPSQPTINPNAKMVALTFDDGPSSTTSQVLDILEQNNAVATFFLIGQNVNGNTKSIMQRQINMGCELACHSYSHQDMGNMSASQVQNEISQCVNAIKSNVNTDIKFFRAPYLSTSQTMFNNINLNFIQGITCNDWESSCSADQRKNTVLSSVSDGSIVLLHDFQGNSNTVQALPGIIQGLKAQGYTLVTVSDLFKYKGVNPNQKGKIWTNVYR